MPGHSILSNWNLLASCMLEDMESSSQLREYTWTCPRSSMLSVVLVPSTFTVGTAFNVLISSQWSVSVCKRGASDLEQGASNRPI